MIASRFRPVLMGAGVLGAALACYLVTQRVAAERAELAQVDRQITQTQKDLRELSTEIVTRTRMPQLERWNVAVLGLTAPGAGQFLDSEIRLASLDAGVPLPIDPAIAAARGAVRTVAYQPARLTPGPAPVAIAAGAAAVEAVAEPLLRQATFVRPRPTALIPAAKPVETAVTIAAGSLLPADIGSLAAVERSRGAAARR